MGVTSTDLLSSYATLWQLLCHEKRQSNNLLILNEIYLFLRSFWKKRLLSIQREVGKKYPVTERIAAHCVKYAHV